MRISTFLFPFVLALFSSDCDVASKKHETAEQLHASDKKIQSQNKHISDGIVGFDADYKAPRKDMNNDTRNSPVPTSSPSVQDYYYFGEDHRVEVPANKNKNIESDEKNGSSENDGDKDAGGDGNRTASYETFKESELPLYEGDETKGAENNETDTSYEEILELA